MARSLVFLAALSVLAGCGSPASPSSGRQSATVRANLSSPNDTPYFVLPWEGGVATMGTHIYTDGTPTTSLWIQPIGGTGFSLSVGSQFYGMGWAANGDRLLIVGLEQTTPSSAWSTVWDGSAWNAVAIDPGVGIYATCAVWTGSRFAVAGQRNSGNLWVTWTSPDGKTWDEAPMSGSPTGSGVIYSMATNGGSAVVGLTNGMDTWVSLDGGQSWTAHFINTSDPDIWPAKWQSGPALFSVVYGNGKWVAVGYNNPDGEALIAVSDTGTSWRPVSFPVNGSLISVAFGDGEFVTGFGSGSTVQFYSSRDGVTWNPRSVLSPDDAPGVGHIDYAEGTFYWSNTVF